MERAEDLIPADAVRLSEAYRVVADAVFEYLDPNAVSLTGWHTLDPALEDIISFLAEDGIFDVTDRKAVHRAANLFFREHLAEKNIVPYVRDPETGDVLQLDAGDWELDSSKPIPVGLFRDHVHPSFADAPGPAGTVIRGKARPVFLVRQEFVQWLTKVFPGSPGVTRWLDGYHEVTKFIPAIGGEFVSEHQENERTDSPNSEIPDQIAHHPTEHKLAVTKSDAEPQANEPAGSSRLEAPDQIAPRPTAHRLAATIEAIIALWGDGGPPVGVTEELRKTAINKKLKEQEKSEVSKATIRRALRAVRALKAERI